MATAESWRWSIKHLKAAFLAMEPPNCFISLARQIGSGYITTELQTSILDLCINNVGEGIACDDTYTKNILKKVIVAAESTSEIIVDGLYEQFAYLMALHTRGDVLKENVKIFKQISFLFPRDAKSDLMDLVVPLQCSLNMLEGDTGCILWPSSLFLAEIILTYPDDFSNKSCFEVGSGVGLVGISLIHAGASKVVLSDGDYSSLENMKYNLQLNQFSSETGMLRRAHSQVDCKHLQWESPSRCELETCQPDIILGADVIYDPLCVPHLTQVLSILLGADLNSHLSGEHQSSSRKRKEVPFAYIAQVIRNHETFDYFLKVAEEAHLSVVDVTETKKPHNLLPYMLSYDRSSVRLFRVSSSRNCSL